MTPANLLTEWARLLVGTLARAGVTHAVISPGSRSTPFTWAALHEPELTTRVIVDERSAAFYALGHAKMTGEPVLLICTSGSAAANYFPAIVEADRSGTPLVVLTADRPFELQAADAPQTIDQVKLYGSAVRHYFEPGMPDASDGALVGLRRIAAQAAALARGPVPGPVHVNARARKPLEPAAAAAADDAGRALRARVDELLGESATVAPAPVLLPPPGAIEDLARACARARRGVIVCGPISPWQAPRPETIAELARRTGFPVLAEATSQVRYADLRDALRFDAFDVALRSKSFRDRFQPDVVLRIGGPPTSTAWRQLMERRARTSGDDARVREHVIAPNGWSDPHSTAATMLVCSPEATLRALVGVLVPGEQEEEFTKYVAMADQLAWDARAVLRPEDEGSFIRALMSELPPRCLLALGNSLPVREVDAFCPGDQRDMPVLSQRGANGIDGLIAGAAGAAEATGRTTVLFLGDVSTLHDVGSLAVARECRTPFAIVVIDNGGGRIFEQLALHGSGVEDRHWSAWLTPPRVDFEALARAFGIEYERFESAGEACDRIGRTLGRPGATLVHVVVDGARTIPAHREYYAEVERRVAALETRAALP